MHQSALLIAGTRPEVIKLAPLYHALKRKKLPVILCATGQHKELLTEALAIFNLVPDVNLTVMKRNQNLFYLTSTLLEKMRAVLEKYRPALVVVQGDTTTAFIGALAAFYAHVPVAHVEAGLRTGNIALPFPEEANRKFISVISQFNFAPTNHAVQNLLAEKIDKHTIFQTGNTIVDALLQIKEKILQQTVSVSQNVQNIVQKIQEKNSKLLLLTAHRRESFGDGLCAIYAGIKQATQQHKNLYVVYPAHPNPQVQDAIHQAQLHIIQNIKIIKPLNYVDMIFMILHADIIATDSGGIQEEGVTLGQHVLILRNETERPEGIHAGFANLVGTNKEAIVQAINSRMHQKNINHCDQHIYGDGTAATQIANIIAHYFKH